MKKAVAKKNPTPRHSLTASNRRAASASVAISRGAVQSNGLFSFVKERVQTRRARGKATSAYRKELRASEKLARAREKRVSAESALKVRRTAAAERKSEAVTQRKEKLAQRQLELREAKQRRAEWDKSERERKQRERQAEQQEKARQRRALAEFNAERARERAEERQREKILREQKGSRRTRGYKVGGQRYDISDREVREGHESLYSNPRKNPATYKVFKVRDDRFGLLYELGRTQREAQKGVAFFTLKEASDCARGLNASVARGAARKAATNNPLITPALAKRLLKSNVGNRPVDGNRVKAIATLMRNGIWKTTKPITLTNGLLTDGQHRLLAVVKAGVPVSMKVQKKTMRASNPLGEITSQLVAGTAAGAAGALAGALAAPIISSYLEKRKARKNPPTMQRAALTTTLEGKRRTVKGFYDETTNRLYLTKYKSKAYISISPSDTLVTLGQAARNPAPAKRPANVSKLYDTFQGRPNSGDVQTFYTPPGSPKDLAQLGRLDYLKLADGRTLKFSRNPAVLCAAGGGRVQKLYIGLQKPYAMPQGVQNGAPLNYGAVKEVGYTASKPHLYGHTKPIHFYHHLGEETGKMPSLVLKNGRLALVGQGCAVRREGIVN